MYKKRVEIAENYSFAKSKTLQVEEHYLCGKSSETINLNDEKFHLTEGEDQKKTNHTYADKLNGSPIIDSSNASEHAPSEISIPSEKLKNMESEMHYQATSSSSALKSNLSPSNYEYGKSKTIHYSTRKEAISKNVEETNEHVINNYSNSSEEKYNQQHINKHTKYYNTNQEELTKENSTQYIQPKDKSEKQKKHFVDFLRSSTTLEERELCMESSENIKGMESIESTSSFPDKAMLHESMQTNKQNNTLEMSHIEENIFDNDEKRNSMRVQTEQNSTSIKEGVLLENSIKGNSILKKEGKKGILRYDREIKSVKIANKTGVENSVNKRVGKLYHDCVHFESENGHEITLELNSNMKYEKILPFIGNDNVLNLEEQGNAVGIHKEHSHKKREHSKGKYNYDEIFDGTTNTDECVEPPTHFHNMNDLLESSEINEEGRNEKKSVNSSFSRSTRKSKNGKENNYPGGLDKSISMNDKKSKKEADSFVSYETKKVGFEMNTAQAVGGTYMNKSSKELNTHNVRIQNKDSCSEKDQFSTGEDKTTCSSKNSKQGEAKLKKGDSTTITSGNNKKKKNCVTEVGKKNNEMVGVGGLTEQPQYSTNFCESSIGKNDYLINKENKKNEMYSKEKNGHQHHNHHHAGKEKNHLHSSDLNKNRQGIDEDTQRIEKETFVHSLEFSQDAVVGTNANMLEVESGIRRNSAQGKRGSISVKKGETIKLQKNQTGTTPKLKMKKGWNNKTKEQMSKETTKEQNGENIIDDDNMSRVILNPDGLNKNETEKGEGGECHSTSNRKNLNSYRMNHCSNNFYNISNEEYKTNTTNSNNVEKQSKAKCIFNWKLAQESLTNMFQNAEDFYYNGVKYFDWNLISIPTLGFSKSSNRVQQMYKAIIPSKHPHKEVKFFIKKIPIYIWARQFHLMNKYEGEYVTDGENFVMEAAALSFLNQYHQGITPKLIKILYEPDDNKYEYKNSSEDGYPCQGMYENLNEFNDMLTKRLKNNSNGYIVMISEFFNEDILDFIDRRQKKYNMKISNNEKLFIMHQCLKLLMKLHDAGLSHLDLTPENILISDNYEMRLCDLAKSTPLFSFNLRHIKTGTSRLHPFESCEPTIAKGSYMPPECWKIYWKYDTMKIRNPLKDLKSVVDQEKRKQFYFDVAGADKFMLGVFFFWIWTNGNVWKCSDPLQDEDFFYFVKCGMDFDKFELTKRWSSELKHIIKHLLHHSYRAKLCLNDLSTHPLWSCKF